MDRLVQFIAPRDLAIAHHEAREYDETIMCNRSDQVKLTMSSTTRLRIHAAVSTIAIASVTSPAFRRQPLKNSPTLHTRFEKWQFDVDRRWCVSGIGEAPSP